MTSFAAVVEALSVRDRVSAGRTTIFAAAAEAVSVRDRVSVGRSTMFAAVVVALSARDRGFCWKINNVCCSCRSTVCQR